MERWPSIPFDRGMIRDGNAVIIHCPDEDLVDELFDVLKSLGVCWTGGDLLTYTNWDRRKEETCYRINSRKRMWHGDVDGYRYGDYDEYIKCTFYGAEPDFEISDTSFERIISTGGVS